MVNEVRFYVIYRFVVFWLRKLGKTLLELKNLGGRAHKNLNWMVWTTALLGLECGLKNTGLLEARSVRLEKSGIFRHSFLSWLVHS